MKNDYFKLKNKELKNSYKSNNYFKIRNFLYNKILWDSQVHVQAITPNEEQEEFIDYLRENKMKIIKHGLHIDTIKEYVSMEEIEEQNNERRLEQRRQVEKKFNRTYSDSHTPAYANRLDEKKLNYGNNKYGKKIIRDMNRGIS